MECSLNHNLSGFSIDYLYIKILALGRSVSLIFLLRECETGI